MPTKGAEGDGKDKRKKKPTSKCGSRSGSRNQTPIGSPSKSNAPDQEEEEEVDDESWTCQKCKERFVNPEDMVMECQRCKDHYCITCLGKTQEEYKILAKSDSMWFCHNCREKVEKNIIIDRKIEEKCKEMMTAFDLRLQSIETDVKTKCDAKEVRTIVQEEIKKSTPTEPSGANCDAEEVRNIVQEEIQKTAPTEPSGGTAETGVKSKNSGVNAVLSEMQERKNRENNLVIYGIPELDSRSKDERKNHDNAKTLEVLKTCEPNIQPEEIKRTIRLGKYDKEKTNRPVLVTLQDSERKRKIFKGANALKETEELEDVRLANDLTQAERENEKTLFEKAKEMEKNCEEGYIYKVRGPPWARRISKTRPEEP